jgi:hypothetical protein
MARERRFDGKLYLVLLENRDSPAVQDGRSLWALQRALTYRAGEARDELITMPAGFVTDLASIPRLVWSIFPPDGPWVKAAVVHDFLYYTQGTGIWGRADRHRGVEREKPYTRAEADRILHEAMLDLGTKPFSRFAIYAAVRIGGAYGWAHKHRHARPHPAPSSLSPRVRRRLSGSRGSGSAGR